MKAQSVFALALGLAGAACALPNDTHMGLTLKGGPEFSTQQPKFNYGLAQSRSDIKPGGTAQLALDLPLAPRVSLSTGVGYDNKGTRMHANDAAGNTITLDQELDYLTVPLYAKGYVPAGIGNLTLGVGPEFGWNMRSRLRDETNDVSLGSGHTRNYDVSLGGILGYEIPFQRHNAIVLEGGYSRGFRSINRNEILQDNNQPVLLNPGANRNTNYRLSAGYKVAM